MLIRKKFIIKFILINIVYYKMLKYSKCVKEIQKMYKKKDRENVRFYKRNRNVCMGVYVKIIYL